MSTPYLIELRRLPESRRLRLTWSDGHEAEYDYDYLRGYCPCAACQGHAIDSVRFHPPAVSVDPVEITPVGNYGISIHWSDRHATGIYRFDFLRQICPSNVDAGAAGSSEDEQGEETS